MSRAGVSVLLIAALICSLPDALAADVAWRVELDGTDVSAAAEARPGAGGVEVNLSRLGDLLRLRVTTDGMRVTIIDTSGRKWTAQAGDLWLETEGERISLPGGTRSEGMAVYMAVEAAARLAELPVTVDRSARQVLIGSPPKRTKASSGRGENAAPLSTERQPILAAAPDGWEPVQVEKSSEEKAETARIEGEPTGTTAVQKRVWRDLREAPQHDRLRLTAIPSLVIGADGAAEIAASGRLMGYDVDGNVAPTFGPNGTQFLSGRVSIGDDAAGWRAQGGDLFSETWGLARGLRYARKVGKAKAKHQTGASLYLQARRDGTDRPMLSLMDQLDLGDLIRLGGEVSSEGSMSGRAGLRFSRFSTDGFYRAARVRNGGAYGAAASVILMRSLSVSARQSTTGAGADRLILRDGAIRIGLFRRIEVLLQETRIQSGAYRTRLDAASVTVPLGQIRWNARYQQKRTEYALSREFNHELTSTVGYRPNRRLSVDAQAVTRWGGVGPTQTWDQFMIQWRLTRTVEAQWSGSLFDPGKTERMRARVQWAARPDLSFIAEYGNVSPYQQVVRTLPGRMIRIAIRKEWDVRSPASGGEVWGQVVDGRGKPVSGVVVEAGPYSTETDTHGEYSLRKLPAGQYQVRLRDDSIPSELYATGPALTFESAGRRQLQAPFQLLNLGKVRGRVCVDANANDKCDAQEGIAMVTLVLGESATSSDTAGAFGFYNLKQGVYRVRLTPASVRKELELVSEAEVEVRVEPGHGEDVVEFRLRTKKEKIIFLDSVTP